ncbi:hypothetical protein CBL_04461 [Carabus blaptoides fortunei]
MATQANLLAIILSLVMLTEQRNIILQDGENLLPAVNRDKRSFEDDVTTPRVAEDTLVSLPKESGTSNTEDSVEFSTTEETSAISSTSASVQREPLDFYGIFLQAVMRSPGDIVAKRSVSYGDDVEDLDTAANTVFRPLFVYRQQNEQRRRLRRLNVF